jgi:hypothetical protein
MPSRALIGALAGEKVCDGSGAKDVIPASVDSIQPMARIGVSYDRWPIPRRYDYHIVDVTGGRL